MALVMYGIKKYQNAFGEFQT